MRWVWIDKFLEFNSRRNARAIKNVSFAEEHLHDHYPGFPVMPGSLIIEGLAQTGGLLVGEASSFEEKVILAKISRAKFLSHACPGDQLTYEVEILDLRPEGAVVEGKARVGDRQVAEVELVFAHLDDRSRAKSLFEPKNFVFTMRLLGVFDVGRTSDGRPLQEPAGLLTLKQRADSESIALSSD